MGSDGSKNNDFFFEMKGKPVFHGNRAFPTILDSLDLFNSDGWVKHVCKKQREFFIEGCPDFKRQ